MPFDPEAYARGESSMTLEAPAENYPLPFDQKDFDAKRKKLGGWDDYIDMFSQAHGADIPDLPKYARAVAMRESGGTADPARAVSPAGAAGIMQLMQPTYEAMGGKDPQGRFNPVENIDKGVKYLASLYREYGDWDRALAAYNSGPGNVDKYGGVPPFKETQDYLSAVHGYRQALGSSNAPVTSTSPGRSSTLDQAINASANDPKLAPPAFDPEAYARGEPATPPPQGHLADNFKDGIPLNQLPPTFSPMDLGKAVRQEMGTEKPLSQVVAESRGTVGKPAVNQAAPAPEPVVGQEARGPIPFSPIGAGAPLGYGPTPETPGFVKGLPRGVSRAFTGGLTNQDSKLPADQQTGAQVGDTLGSLLIGAGLAFAGPPGWAAIGGYGMMREGASMKDQGKDMTDPGNIAQAGTAGALQEGMVPAPVSLGTSLARRLATGTLMGAAQNVLQDAAKQIEEKGAVNLHDPNMLTSAILGGAFGLGFASAFKAHPEMQAEIHQRVTPEQWAAIKEAVANPDLPQGPYAKEAAAAAPPQSPDFVVNPAGEASRPTPTPPDAQEEAFSKAFKDAGYTEDQIQAALEVMKGRPAGADLEIRAADAPSVDKSTESAAPVDATAVNPAGGKPEVVNQPEPKFLTAARENLARKYNLQPDDPAVTDLVKDPLTGVLSRYAFDADSKDAALGDGFASIDVAGLKGMNDRFGHDTGGDVLLKAVADAMTHAAEETGARAYRTGGDEFYFRAKDEATAKDAAQRAKMRLAKQKLQIFDANGKRTTIVRNPRLDYGYGPTAAHADERLRTYRRRAESLPTDHPEYRSPRGTPPDVGGAAGPGEEAGRSASGDRFRPRPTPGISSAKPVKPSEHFIVHIGQFVAGELTRGNTLHIHPDDVKRLQLYHGEATNPRKMPAKDMWKALGKPVRIDPSAQRLSTIAHRINETYLAQKPGERPHLIGADRPDEQAGFHEDDLARALISRPRTKDKFESAVNEARKKLSGETHDAAAAAGAQAADEAMTPEERAAMDEYTAQKAEQRGKDQATNWQGDNGEILFQRPDPNQQGLFGEGKDRPAEQTDIFGQKPKAPPATGRASEPPYIPEGVKPGAAPQPKLAGGVQDLGEKIGGARKDVAESTGPRAKVRAPESEEPGWRKRFEVTQIIKSRRPGEEGRWVVHDARTKDWTGQPRQVGRETFATQAEAEAAIPLMAVSMKHRVTSDGVAGDSYKIVRDVTDRKRVTIKDGFKTREEAIRYMIQHASEIVETKTGFGEEILATPEKVMRQGPARRKGDVAGDNFLKTFGFRGVEFGNWNNQVERQHVMNHAYDALTDLADLLNVPPKAIGLNGELALAFGARGQGLVGAKAHYERDYGVINLTKMTGAGSLAHEWFHALDHYLGRQDTKAAAERVANSRGDLVYPARIASGSDMVSHGFSRNKSGVREELRTAYDNLMSTMFKKAVHYVEDTQNAERFAGAAREGLKSRLDDMRARMSRKLEYGKRNIEPASAEQLAAFDALAEKLVSGDALATEYRMDKEKGRRAYISGRNTNDVLEQISTIYKDVRGRTGFNAENTGELDHVRQSMNLYGARLKMLADANGGEQKTKSVPTSYAMDAKAIDQGRASDYWTTPHEMAARAFSAYVEDKLAAHGNQSDFLSFGADNNLYRMFNARPFPEGKERVAINEAFDKFMGVLKSKETENGTALYQGESPKGQFHMEGQKAVITLFKGKADFSTWVHEYGHFLRRAALAGEDMTTAEKWLSGYGIKVKDEVGKWTEAAEEKFARGFERYFRDGKAAKGMDAVFEKIAKWMRQIYQSIRGTALEDAIPDHMRWVYDRLVGGEGEKPSAEGKPAEALFQSADASPDHVGPAARPPAESMGRSDLKGAVSYEAEKGPARSGWITKPEQLYTDAVNEAHPVEKIQSVFEKEAGRPLTPDQSIKYAINRVLGSGGSADLHMEKNLKPIYQGGVNAEGVHFDALTPAEARQLDEFAIARDTLWRYENTEGFDNPALTREHADRLMTKFNALPAPLQKKIRGAANGLVDYSKDLAARKLKAGLWTQEEFDRIVKNPYYIPEIRNFAAVTNKPLGKGKKRLLTSTNKLMRGTFAVDVDAPVFDPVSALVHDTRQFAAEAAKMGVWNKVIDLVDSSPTLKGWIKRMPADYTPATTEGEVAVLRPRETHISEKQQVFAEEYDKAKFTLERDKNDQRDTGTRLYMRERLRARLYRDKGNLRKSAEDMEEIFRKEEVSYLAGREKAKEAAEKVMEDFRKLPPKEQQLIEDWNNEGRAQIYLVPKEIADAVNGMTPMEWSFWQKPMIAAASLFRRMQVGWNPDFTLSNTPRDLQEAYFNVGINPWYAFKGMYHYLKKDDVYEAYLRHGGAMEGDESGFRASTDTGKEIRYGKARSGAKDKAVGFLTDRYNKARDAAPWAEKKATVAGREISYGRLARMAEVFTQTVKMPFEAAGAIGEAGEMMSRLGVMDMALKQKKLDPRAAADMARQATLDFKRIGAKMKSANAMIPFLNARIQGMDRLIRTAKQDPVGAATRAFISVAAPTALLLAWNQKNPHYKEIPAWEKQYYWIIMSPHRNGYMKVAKGALAQLIGNPVQMLFENWMGTANQEKWQIVSNMAKAGLPVDDVGGTLNPLVKIPLELTSNYDYYFNRDIVKAPGAPAEYQADPSTSETLKTIGRGLAWAPSTMMTNWLKSPEKLQHVSNTLLGGTATNLLFAIDYALGNTGLQEAPKTDVSRIPFVKRVFGETEAWKSDLAQRERELRRDIKDKQQALGSFKFAAAQARADGKPGEIERQQAGYKKTAEEARAAMVELQAVAKAQKALEDMQENLKSKGPSK